MKRIALGILAAAVMFTAGPAMAKSVADYPAGASANGIGGSRHNLGSMGPVLHTTDGTTEICVFCHTPHHGSTNAPLWNKGEQSTSYTAYGNTLAGTSVGGPGGATLACLSCHDGVNTFDTLVNAPGKGNGTGNNTTATDMGWEFGMPGGLGFTADPSFDHFGNPSCSICHKEDDPSGPARLNIGTTLANDHPVSVAYTAGKASLRDPSTVIASIDLTDGLANTTTVYPDNISQNRWAVGGSVSATATISDLLRDGKVECSSCHDPHFSNKSWDEVETMWNQFLSGAPTWCTGDDCTDGNFLRRVGGNTGSGVCRTCHNK